MLRLLSELLAVCSGFLKEALEEEAMVLCDLSNLQPETDDTGQVFNDPKIQNELKESPAWRKDPEAFLAGAMKTIILSVSIRLPVPLASPHRQFQIRLHASN